MIFLGASTDDLHLILHGIKRWERYERVEEL